MLSRVAGGGEIFSHRCLFGKRWRREAEAVFNLPLSSPLRPTILFRCLPWGEGQRIRRDFSFFLSSIYPFFFSLLWKKARKPWDKNNEGRRKKEEEGGHHTRKKERKTPPSEQRGGRRKGGTEGGSISAISTKPRKGFRHRKRRRRSKEKKKKEQQKKPAAAADNNKNISRATPLSSSSAFPIQYTIFILQFNFAPFFSFPFFPLSFFLFLFFFHLLFSYRSPLPPVLPFFSFLVRKSLLEKASKASPPPPLLCGYFQISGLSTILLLLQNHDRKGGRGRDADQILGEGERGGRRKKKRMRRGGQKTSWRRGKEGKRKGGSVFVKIKFFSLRTTPSNEGG